MVHHFYVCAFYVSIITSLYSICSQLTPHQKENVCFIILATFFLILRCYRTINVQVYKHHSIKNTITSGLWFLKSMMTSNACSYVHTLAHLLFVSLLQNFQVQTLNIFGCPRKTFSYKFFMCEPPLWNTNIVTACAWISFQFHFE
jgi:hypothetical protein